MVSRVAVSKTIKGLSCIKLLIMGYQYEVYVLIKDKKPVYVGSSRNVKNRLSCHKQTKDFDEHIILKGYNYKKEALIAENSLIRFISIFGGDEWINCKHVMLVLDGSIKGYNNQFKEEVSNG